MTDVGSLQDKSVPWLMREARGAYADAARRALAEIECDDVPRNGGPVLAGLAGNPEAEFTWQADAVAALRLSKQAASQLIDTLVLRGYLERRIDPEDRRRMGVRLTDRGHAAAAAIHSAIELIDAALERRITVQELHGLRAGLAALAAIRSEAAGE